MGLKDKLLNCGKDERYEWEMNRENGLMGIFVILSCFDRRKGIFVTSSQTLLSQCATLAN